MRTCGNPACQGHLGKFSNCLAETLHLLTLYDGADEVTGTVEFRGHYSLLLFPEDEKIGKDNPLDHLLDTIPRGFYILHENDQGFVTLATYDTEAEARTVFDAADEAYSTWLESEEDHD